MSEKKKKNRKGLITYILLTINAILVISLAFSYLSLYIDPEIFSFFAFFGLLYPVLLLLNLIMMVFWIVFWKRYFVLSLAFILIGWNVMTRHYGINPECKTAENDSFKVMSYNVQNLSNNNMHRQDKSVRDQIFNILSVEKPDVLCMQEFYYTGGDRHYMIDDLKKSLGLPYSYSKNYFQSNSKIHALVTFSKFPIVSEGYIKNNEGRVLLIYTDLKIDNDTLRLINMHMQSFKFRKKDLDFVKELGKTANNDELREGSKSIIRRLHNAYVLRSDEAKVFNAFSESSDFPLIICCDMNDTPASYTFHKVSGKLKDTFRESGAGIAKTYTESLLPLRIDYILVDRKLSSCDHRTHDAYTLSDHYPVSCRIGLNK